MVMNKKSTKIKKFYECKCYVKRSKSFDLDFKPESKPRSGATLEVFNYSHINLAICAFTTLGIYLDLIKRDYIKYLQIQR